MTIQALAKALPLSTESVLRSVLLSHFSDLEKEIALWHSQQTDAAALIIQLRNTVANLDHRCNVLEAELQDRLATTS